MRRSLERLAADCHGAAGPDCPILEDLIGATDESATASPEPPAVTQVERLSS